MTVYEILTFEYDLPLLKLLNRRMSETDRAYALEAIPDGVVLKLRGKARGEFQLAVTPDFQTICARIPVSLSGGEQCFSAPCSLPEGVQPLYFRFVGEGACGFIAFTLHAKV